MILSSLHEGANYDTNINGILYSLVEYNPTTTQF